MNIDRQILGFMLSLGMIAGCTQTTMTPTEPSKSPTAIATNLPTVIATNSTICDLTKQVAGETIVLKCLIAGGVDPHVYQVTAADRQSLETANLILYGGYNFERDLVKIIESNKSPKVNKVAVFEKAVPEPYTFEEDGKSTKDPHAFHDAKNGVKIVSEIKLSLAKVVPDRSSEYARNAQKIQAELTQLDTWIKAQIATIPPANKTLVTTHDALGYYAKAYSIPLAAVEGVSTEEKPTAATIKAVIDRIKKSQVPTIFTELNVNPQVMQTVANDAKVKISESAIFADGLGAPDSEASTYQKMLIANTKSIVTGLGGKYTPFSAN
jgi:manganese/iron transport system substrate-binding protein